MIQSYKGVRDFYPKEERLQRYLFSVMEKTVRRFGYEPYHASLLELTELYTQKTSEEILKEQTYTFTDRGGRSVTLRPEMTPTTARMVASKKRELTFPLRWYSVPNCFRYERPQKGRLREFWQLNVDLFGAEGIAADAEIIEIAYTILKNFGAKDDSFVIKVADRALLETAFDAAEMNDTQKRAYRNLLDKRSKMDPEEFTRAAKAITEKDPISLIESTDDSVREAECAVRDLVATLQERGVTNAIFDPSIVRGFDYYTGMVFEVFDTSGENTRSLFGGGRYDYLVEEYDTDHTPAVGFGMGDVPTRDFLLTHHLIPERVTAPDSEVYLAPADSDSTEHAAQTASFLREKGVNVVVGIKPLPLSTHQKHARKMNIPYFIAYGEKERETGMVSVKELSSKKILTVPLFEVPRVVGSEEW